MSNNNSTIMTTKSGKQTHVAPTGSTISVCGVRVTTTAQHGASVTCERCAQSWSTHNAFINVVPVIEKIETPKAIEITGQPLTWAQARAMKAAQ